MTEGDTQRQSLKVSETDSQSFTQSDRQSHFVIQTDSQTDSQTDRGIRRRRRKGDDSRVREVGEEPG